MAIIAEREIKGHIYETHVKGGPNWLKQQNITSVVAALNDETGDEMFFPWTDSIIPPNDLKKMKATLARQAFDTTDVTMDNSSHVTISTSALIKQRGGHPRFKIPKPKDSFILGDTPKSIAKQSRKTRG